MNFLLLDPTIRTCSQLFMSIGILIFIIDYRRVKNNPNQSRERTFSKVVGLMYVLGGLCVLITLQVINWVS